MATDTRVGANGKVWLAAPGVIAPADHVQAFGTGWFDVGLITEDGVTIMDGKETWDEGAWQSFYATDRGVSSRSARVSFTLKEGYRKANFLFAFGGTITQVPANSTATPPIAAHALYEPPNPQEIGEMQLVVEWFPTTTIKVRRFYPRGLLVDDIEQVLAREATIKLPLTFDVIGSEGVKAFYQRSNDPLWAA